MKNAVRTRGALFAGCVLATIAITPSGAGAERPRAPEEPPTAQAERACGRDRLYGQGPAWCQPQLGSSGGAARADFNGDGFSDLAVGSPYEAVDTVDNGGIVQALYGSSLGLNPASSRNIWQGRDGLAGQPEANDLFGAALAAGDFDGDGFSDLAVGIPGQTVNGVVQAGAVQIIFGSAAGLNPSRSQTVQALRQTQGEHFGQALVWGNFGRGPQADLAIGAKSATSSSGGGYVAVLYGSTTGLVTTGPQVIEHQHLGYDVTASSTGYEARVVLAAGNVDGTTPEDELVVGANITFTGPSSSSQRTGVVILRGTEPGGLDTARWTPLAHDGTAAGHVSAIAIGDFGNRGVKGLAVGWPNTDRVFRTERGNTGGLVGLFSTPMTSTTPGMISQLTPGIPSEPPPVDCCTFERFGATLAAGDFNGDGFIDLAVGNPTENDPVPNAGGVTILYGARSGVLGGGATLLSQSAGLSGTAESNDKVGAALSAWNWGRGPATDLAIGAPNEAIGSTFGAGALHVLYGGGGGIGSNGQQLFTQDLFGLSVEPGDWFGGSVY